MNRVRQLGRVGLLALALLCVAAWVSASGETEADTATGDIHITGWMPWSPAGVPDDPQYSDHVMFRAAEERFGIYIDWTVVPSADASAALGLLIASGDLPDLIGRTFGPTYAQDYGRQGAFIALEDYIAERAPNLTKLMEDVPAIKGQTVSPDGHIYFFPRTMEDLPRSWPGFHIREDWLNVLGLDMPQNLSELETVLRAFRDDDPNGNGERDEIPFSGEPRVFIWAFGVGSRGFNNPTDFFVEDGIVKNGTTDPRFREAIELLSQWYAEGLIDHEYLGQTGDEHRAKVTGNQVGVSFGSFAGYMTLWNRLLRADGIDGRYVVLPPPAGPTGLRNSMGGHKELDPSCGAAITVASDYPGEITEMMDYFYGEEGRRYLYFGEEGVHYTMQNGVPVYTDLVANDPSLAIATYMNTYVGFISVWPSSLPNQAQLSLYDAEGKEGLRVTAQHETDRKIPNLQFTAEELRSVQEISRDLNTYTDEWVHGFIRGQKSMAQWDEFQAGLLQLDVEQLTSLYNSAYGRYLEATEQR